MSALFTTLASITNIYSFICIIAIFMTWIPGLKFTSFGKFISAITDPYLNLFSKIKFLRVGMIDFSAMLGVGVLSLLSSIFARISATGRIYLGGILFSIIYMIWNICSTLIIIFTILIFIRWLNLVIKKGQTPYNSSWNQIDLVLQKVTWKISKIFARKPIKYQSSLLISWIFGAVVYFAGTILINIILALCSNIPF